MCVAHTPLGLMGKQLLRVCAFECVRAHMRQQCFLASGEFVMCCFSSWRNWGRSLASSWFLPWKYWEQKLTAATAVMNSLLKRWSASPSLFFPPTSAWWIGSWLATANNISFRPSALPQLVRKHVFTKLLYHSRLTVKNIFSLDNDNFSKIIMSYIIFYINGYSNVILAHVGIKYAQ